MYMQLVVAIYVLFVVKYSCGDSIPIGALFDDDADYSETLKFALDDINKRGEYGVTLEPMYRVIHRDDAFGAAIAACEILASGAIGIFGPFSAENVDSVHSVCDVKEIPQILSKWKRYNLFRGNSILNVFPDPEALALAYIDIIQVWEWKEFVILYQSDDNFYALSALMNYASELKMYTVLRQLDEDESGIYRTTLKEVRDSGMKNILLDCSYESLSEVLHQAQQIGMISGEYKFFIANLDLQTIPLSDFQFSAVQMLGIRIVSPESELVKEVSSAYLGTGDPVKDLLYPPEWKLRSDDALMIDGVNMFVSSLNQLNLKSYVLTQDLSCNSTDSWKDGLTVLNLMKTSIYQGLTGEVRFDTDGIRSEFKLDVIELREGGIVQIGQWNASSSPNHKRLNIVQPPQSMIYNDDESLRNRSFIVEICLTEPYAMWKDSSENLVGNDRFEGYAIDLIQKLAELEGFQYTFKVRVDSDNGGKDQKTGEWGGMIGDVINNVTDLAIADLTITSEREEAVDFTDAFMNLGITILFERAKKAPPSFFSFAEPFSLDTWGTLLVSVIVVALSYYIIARFSPEEWTNPDPCKDDPEFLTNQFSMANSFWFTIASLMQQGTEIAPIGYATRALTGAWWFFILIIVASYTANLTAFLSTEKPDELFKSLDELVSKGEELGIRYGAKKGGATYKFFNSTSNDLYMKVFKYMNEHPENMMSENKFGVEEAKKGKYAFFMESTSIEYATQRNCDVDKVGETMDPNKGYAIAMRKNSSYRKRLNLAILNLQSQGILEMLKTKWWEERRGGGACKDDDSAQPEATPLYIGNVVGVFFVTVYGMVLAVIMALFEWLSTIIKLSRKKGIPFTTAFMIELRFFLNFEQLVKPLKASSSAKSDASSGTSVRYRSKFRSRSRLRFGSRAASICRSRSRSRSTSKSRSKAASPTSRASLRSRMESVVRNASLRSIASSRPRSRHSGSRSKSIVEPFEMHVHPSRSPSKYLFKRGISQEKLTEDMDE